MRRLAQILLTICDNVDSYGAIVAWVEIITLAIAPSSPNQIMKKLFVFGLAALTAFVVLTRLSHVVQARVVIAPTPTPAPVISAR